MRLIELGLRWDVLITGDARHRNHLRLAGQGAVAAPRQPGRDALAMLEGHARAVADVGLIRGLQNKRDIKAAAWFHRPQSPLELRLLDMRLRTGPHQPGIGRQQVFHDHVMRLRRRVVIHTNAIFDGLAWLAHGRHPYLYLDHRRGRITWFHVGRGRAGVLHLQNEASRRTGRKGHERRHDARRPGAPGWTLGERRTGTRHRHYRQENQQAGKKRSAKGAFHG